MPRVGSGQRPAAHRALLAALGGVAAWRRRPGRAPALHPGREAGEGHAALPAGAAALLLRY